MRKNVFASDSSTESDDDIPIKTVAKKFTIPSQSVDVQNDDSDDDYMLFKLLGAEGLEKYEYKRTIESSILNEDSVGLSIMMKMGFKIGDTLGRQGKENAIKEPISVKVKRDRVGLGGNTFISFTEGRPVSINEYRSHALEKHAGAKNRRILAKLQKFCYERSGDDEKVLLGEKSVTQVDEMWRSQAIEKPDNSWVRLFAEKDPPKLQVELGAFQELSVEDQLGRLVAFSRKAFFYCAYCGICYTDKQDLESNCPGPSEADHPF